MNHQSPPAPVSRQALMMQGQGRQIAPASQSTHIEQSRAVAQVQGALIVAQQRPRDEIGARQRMEEACQLQALAEHAFFRYSRGGSQINGPSIHLATELARCWGNVDYGISELSRDDIKGESEMLAYAWDLETNSRITNAFIVPHKRDKKGGAEHLTEMRDIYENNANAAARRLRECIFRVLPKAFVEEAKDICRQTLESGGGEPIEKRRVTLLEAFSAAGVTRRQIEKKMGRQADKLTAFDIGVLRTVYGSLRRGETEVEDEFEPDSAGEVSAELRNGSAQQPKSVAQADTPGPKPAETPAEPPRDAFGLPPVETTTEQRDEVPADDAQHHAQRMIDLVYDTKSAKELDVLAASPRLHNRLYFPPQQRKAVDDAIAEHRARLLQPRK